MRSTRSALVALAAIAVAIAPALVSASDRAEAPKNKASVATGQFAALKDVKKAVPMTPQELRAIKGRDAHFVTVNSKNTGFNGQTGWHFVNWQNRDNWVDLGNGILVGPGYHGLCGAALKSPGIVIPGQNTSTGIGGGC
jgi:hypothetical protein